MSIFSQRFMYGIQLIGKNNKKLFLNFKNKNNLVGICIEGKAKISSSSCYYYNKNYKAKKPNKNNKAKQIIVKEKILIPLSISIAKLSTLLGIPMKKLGNQLMKLGFNENELDYDYILDGETAALISEEFGFEPQYDNSIKNDIKPDPISKDVKKLLPRPPIVTIMGHVDHGKTTILDYLRKSSVAASEVGGITQHIGAFSVKLPSGKLVTFLDTPGHSAFLKMRERGANVTDIIVLVVAGDDSVMPQTLEAIKHAKKYNVPMIVAINKIDKPESNPKKVMTDLASKGVEIEDFGGDVQVVPVSGLTGQGIDALVENIVALSEILDLKAEKNVRTQGSILEAQVKHGKGPVATVLVSRGTLTPGQVIIAGTAICKVKSMYDEHGKIIKKAGPSIPAEVLGWRSLPEAGDLVLSAENERVAKKVIEAREEHNEQKKSLEEIAMLNKKRRIERLKSEENNKTKSTENNTPLFQDENENNDESVKILPIIIRGDVAGSVEAIQECIQDLGNDEVKVKILYSAVGPPADSDLLRAKAAKAMIISFNIKPEKTFMNNAESEGIDVIQENIIYRVIETVTEKLTDMLGVEVERSIKSETEIRALFSINLKGQNTANIAGCRVTNGILKSRDKVQVLRGKNVIYSGTLASLKIQKKDAESVGKGNECGVAFVEFDDFKVGDVIQSYDEIEKPRHL